MNNIGKIYFDLGQINKALINIRHAIDVAEKIKNYMILCYLYIHLAEIKIETKKLQEALNDLDKAIYYAEMYNQPHMVAKVYLYYSKVNFNMGNEGEQKEYLSRCIAISEANNYRGISLEAYMMLAEYHEKNSDFKTAYSYSKKIQELQDFLNNEKRVKAIEEIKTRMEVERTEREKEILEQKNIELQRMNKKINQQKKKLEAAEKELTELNRTLEVRVKEEIEKRRQQEHLIIHKSKLESLGQMAAGIVHEINQPLGLIQLANQNLIIKYENEQLDDCLLRDKTAFISSNVTRIKKIIEHVRIFSRNQKDVREKFNVIDTVNDALSMVSTQCFKHNIIINKIFETKKTDIIGNKYRLEQVLINLFTNAIDALEEKSKAYTGSKEIIVRVGKNSELSFIEVVDNGCGIEKPVLNKVFDPFYTTKSESKGTGLGLSICYGIITDMKGNITIKSEKSKYTKIRIELPIIQ